MPRQDLQEAVTTGLRPWSERTEQLLMAHTSPSSVCGRRPAPRCPHTCMRLAKVAARPPALPPVSSGKG